MNGATLGAAAGIGLNSEFAYGVDNSVLSFPAASVGFVPTAGASYHLSRMDNGVGMFLGLTGVALQGRQLYDSKLVEYFTNNQFIQSQLVDYVGQGLQAPTAHWAVEYSADYKRNLREIREAREELRATLVQDIVGEQKAEVLNSYIRHRIFRTYYLMGEKQQAQNIIDDTTFVPTPEEIADNVDFFAAPETEDKDVIAEPTQVVRYKCLYARCLFAHCSGCFSGNGLHS